MEIKTSMALSHNKHTLKSVPLTYNARVLFKVVSMNLCIGT